MTADVASHFTTAGREADQNRVFQIERLDHSGEVVRVGVHLVSVPRLVGSAVTASVVGDATITVRRQEKHLALPTVRIERPAVTELHGLSRAPILVVNLRAILRLQCAHASFSPIIECLEFRRKAGRRERCGASRASYFRAVGFLSTDNEISTSQFVCRNIQFVKVAPPRNLWVTCGSQRWD